MANLQHDGSPFSTYRRTIGDWWDNWIIIVVLGLIWLLSLLTILLFPPATFGFNYFINRLTNGENVGFQGFLSGARVYWWKSYQWAALNLLIIVVLGGSFLFYTQAEDLWAVILKWAIVLVAAFWFTDQYYALPYFMEQRRKQLWLAYKNAALTLIVSPGHALFTLVLAAGMLILNFLIPVMLVLGGPGLLVLYAHNTVRSRIAAFIEEQNGDPGAHFTARIYDD